MREFYKTPWVFICVALVLLTVVQAENSKLTAPLTAMEKEQMVQDFVDFCRFNTESDEGAPIDKIPSTASQREFTVMLSKTLQWPQVEVDSLG